MLKSSLITGGILALFLIHASPEAVTTPGSGQPESRAGDIDWMSVPSSLSDFLSVVWGSRPVE